MTFPLITKPTAEYLLSAEGRALLAEASALLADRKDTLTALTRLRKLSDPERALAAWDMADLRKRGTAKFGQSASAMYFVREALEQASGRGTADYHARRFRDAGITTISDLGGGIGGDALAFARAGLQVILYERDSLRAGFAEENARVCGLNESITIINGDAMASEITTEAAWLDPARRVGSRRVSDPEDYTPPLSWLHELSATNLRAIGVKLSPAIDHTLAEQHDAEIEFLSESGECREALLWLGSAQSGQRLQATLLANDGTQQTLAGAADALGHWTAPTGSRYLYEPDPAVIRAHLIGTLGMQIHATAVDPQIAYLVGDILSPTPFADIYEVLERFPYSLKRLQTALTVRDVGRVIIKKRGFLLEPDAVRKLLKLRGMSEMIVVVARIGAGHDVFLCRHISTGAA